MRISSITVNAIPPIHYFKADNLSDVVVIAGQNGIGKSRLVNSLLHRFQNHQPSSNVNFSVEATSENERKSWGKTTLDTTNQDDIKKLAATLQAQKNRTKWNSSVIYFESDRVVTKIDPYPFNWDSPDPENEAVGWNTTFNGGLKTRL